MKICILKRQAVALLFLFFASSLSVQSGFADGLNTQSRHPDRHKPELRDAQEYKEYWDQYFVFEDGTLLTTQFSVLNLPFNKHRGIVLATLVRPDGATYIIKNGRAFGDWVYAEDKFDIRFGDEVDHYIRGAYPDYQLKLHNTTAEVELDLTSHLPVALPLLPENSKNLKADKIQMMAYAPYFTATGRFRIGPEVGGEEHGPWISLGQGAGFGMRVLVNDNLDKLMDTWLRVFSLDNGAGPELILSSITLPKGAQENMLYLRGAQDIIDGFRDIRVTPLVYGEDKELGQYPVKLPLSAGNGDSMLEGTLTLTKKLEHFRLNDHMGSLERMLAKAYPSLNRYRYIAEYDLVYKTGVGTKKVTGKALSEFVDILSPTVEKKKRVRKKR